ncbi:hypothetical protein [Streptomyces sp. NRRL F-5123]|uniref:hypothetical protein n=1 Tax=Streptomyces sp. NRRL F-5123 TaxID=1463856 RepID=UPI00131B53A3|nr:hypothetical protein [Streptomyces sp. NRRL F-5123]
MPIRADHRLPAGSRAVAAAALLPVLVLVAGCGSGDDGKDAPNVAKGVVSTTNLTAALLTSTDVPHVQVLPAGTKQQLLGDAQKADTAACQPIVDQWTSQPKYRRQVYTGAMVTDTTDAGKDKGAKAISLSVIASYKKGDAAKVLDDLTTAVTACHSYSVVRGGVTSHFTVRPAAADAGLGDQRVAYVIGETTKGATSEVLVTVVRVGDTTEAYETVRADHKPAQLRTSIPVKQAAKLRDAAKGS